MSFLKSMWKANSRHKKLCEEWALATSLRDLGDLPADSVGEEDESESVTFDVKHLGDTSVVEAANTNSTEAIIGQAVKSVLSAAKAVKPTRVNLTVSSKGIEIIDRTTSETLQQISIYRISNCSADVTHSNVFAFISSPSNNSPECDKLDASPGRQPPQDGPLTCHVFLCQKRKVAQNIAITVAKSFERAFEIWQFSSGNKGTQASDKQHVGMKIEEDADAAEEPEDNVVNLLIDLNSDELTDIRKSYLQNTWVSFEETEYLMSNLHKNAICS